MSTQHVTPAGGNIFADLNVLDAENEKLRYQNFTIDRLVRMLACVGKRIGLTISNKAA